MSVKRHFMGWDRPVVEAAGAALILGRRGRHLDLRDTLVVVPTAHSGRRLREHVAVLAAERGGAALPGPLVTPDQLMATSLPSATRLATWVAWAGVLGELAAGEAAALLPRGVGDDFVAALSTGRSLAKVCDTLGEAGLEPMDVLRDHDGLDEPERWQDFAALHARVIERLAVRGLEDRNRARRDAAATVTVPPGVRQVMVLAVPDPTPLALQALERLAEQAPVEIHIHAPDALRDAFDSWGRARPEQWTDHVLPLGDDKLHVALRPADQAATVGELMDHLDRPVEDLVVGLPNPDLAPALDRTLSERGAAAWDPGGRPLAGHRIAGLVSALGALVRQDSAEAFARLARHPDFLARVRVEGHDPVAALIALDAVRVEAIPVTFSRLRQVAASGGDAALVCACDVAAEAAARLRAGPVPQVLRGLLGEIYGAVERDDYPSEEHALRDGAAAVADLLDELEAPGVGDLGLGPAEVSALLMAAMEGRRTRAPARPDRAVDLVGWLELQWDDAPTLILTGMNDGLVPESITGDPFLPDSARVCLGLPSNRDRFARDAYLLHGMCAWRAARGGVHLVTGRVDDRGDPLRPSRLLFLVDDDALPARTRRLFSEVETEGALVARSWGEPLRPRQAPSPTRLRVTAFKDYLTCPFRFYLRQVLGMEEVDDRGTEMGPMEFGSLCHAALEEFGREDGLRDSDDPDRVAAFLKDRADAWVRRRYGKSLSAPLQMQLEAARQRLTWAAASQAEERRAGWRIVAAEHIPGGEAGVMVAGTPVRGRIDRIDRHVDGRIRVLDYKTGEAAPSPAQAHLGPAREDDLDWVAAATSGRPQRWLDLQLPLYAILLEEEFGDDLEVGYFHLPRAVRDTGVVTWEDMRGDLLASARICAAGVVESIRRQVFWPPRQVKWDDTMGIFFGAPEQVVDAAWMEAMVIDGETP